MSLDYAQMKEAFKPAWGPLAKAFGPAMDSEHRIGFRLGPEELPAAGSAGRALKEAIGLAWEIRLSLAEDDSPFSSLGANLFTEFTQGALATVSRAGHFMAALEAFDSHAEAIGPHWRGDPAVARLARLACDDDQHGRKAPADLARRWEALAASPWWSVPTSKQAVDQALMEDSAKLWWRAGLSEMARQCALRPERSAAAAKVVAQWAKHCWPALLGQEHFARELGRELGHEKIAKGEIPGPIWAELPFRARLGIGLGVHAESNLGQWSAAQLVRDLAADTTEQAPARRRTTCAAFWSALELPRIEALEAAFPDTEEWMRPALHGRMAGSGPFASTALEWLLAEKNWMDKRSAWAHRLRTKAGLASPTDGAGFKAAFWGKAEEYSQALIDVRTLRQAAQIKAILPKKAKAARDQGRRL